MRVAGCFAALILVLTGCGTAEPDPLSARLGEVDAAAVAGDSDALESAVGGLLAAVDDAAAAGDLEPTRARRIREAAQALLTAAADPDPAASEGPTPTPAPAPPVDDEGPREDDEDDEADDD